MTRLAETFTTTDLTFTSGGVPVRMTVFAPAGAVARPAVLVVHGASGLNASNRYVRQVAEAWAAEGFVTLLVHYFDRTKTEYASETLIFQEFETWLATISDAISFGTTLACVDPARLGLAGYSLGGYLVVASAARDARIRAAVEIAGGIDGETELLAGKLPPLLLVHGEADRRVPFTKAQHLQAVLEKNGRPFETRFYPGEGHFLSATAALNALEAGAVFLQKFL